MNDELVLKKILSGDRDAFQFFYEETRVGLEKMVGSRIELMDDVEELVQDVYLAFLDSLPMFEGKSNLKTFLWAIARHEVADYWRKKYAKKAIRTVPFVDQIYSENLYSATTTGLVINMVYDKIREGERKILKMKYEQGMSVREISNGLSISLKAAESKLFRARKSFQLAYEQVDERVL